MTAMPLPDEARYIPQRELRNDSSRILREVEQGSEFIVTTRGIPVARLSPFCNDPHHSQLPYSTPSLPQVFSVDELAEAEVPVDDILDDYREDRF